MEIYTTKWKHKHDAIFIYAAGDSEIPGYIWHVNCARYLNSPASDDGAKADVRGHRIMSVVLYVEDLRRILDPALPGKRLARVHSLITRCGSNRVLRLAKHS